MHKEYRLIHGPVDLGRDLEVHAGVLLYLSCPWKILLIGG